MSKLVRPTTDTGTVDRSAVQCTCKPGPDAQHREYCKTRLQRSGDDTCTWYRAKGVRGVTVLTELCPEPATTLDSTGWPVCDVHKDILNAS